MGLSIIPRRLSSKVRALSTKRMPKDRAARRMVIRQMLTKCAARTLVVGITVYAATVSKSWKCTAMVDLFCGIVVSISVSWCEL